jgi:hypothetical protein
MFSSFVSAVEKFLLSWGWIVVSEGYVSLGSVFALSALPSLFHSQMQTLLS